MRESTVPEQFYQPTTMSDMWKLYNQATQILKAAMAHLDSLDNEASAILIEAIFKTIEVGYSTCDVRCLERAL